MLFLWMLTNTSVMVWMVRHSCTFDTFLTFSMSPVEFYGNLPKVHSTILFELQYILLNFCFVHHIVLFRPTIQLVQSDELWFCLICWVSEFHRTQLWKWKKYKERTRNPKAYVTPVRVEVVPFIEIPLYYIYSLISSLELHTYHISDSFYLIY